MPIDVPRPPNSAPRACIAAGIGCGMFTDYASATDGMVKVKKTYYPNPRAQRISIEKPAAYEKAPGCSGFLP